MNKTFFCALIFLSIFLITGCGGGDGGLSDWAKPAPATVVSNIEGRVISPVIGANQLFSSLVSVEGSRVFIEEKPEFFAIADNGGNFILENVPTGKYHLIVELLSGTNSYRQRTDQINLTGEYATLALSAPVQLVAAPYKLKVEVVDLKSQAPVTGGRLKTWGREYLPDSQGKLDVGPLPEGVWPISLSAAGYHPYNFLAGFARSKNAQMQLKLTPLAAVDPNRAPVVEIEQGFLTIRTNDQGTLLASAFDPDGDRVSYSWKASKGHFLQNTGASTVFVAPAAAGQVQIELTAKDSNGAEAKSVLNIDVLDGGGLPTNPNNRPPLAASEPFPANVATNLGIQVMLRWVASDPDGDQLTFDVFLAERGQDLTLLAEDISQTSYQLNNLKVNTTYLWMIISRDVYGAISPGPQTWQFTTSDQDNFSPYQPANPFPEDLAVDQLPALQFSWTGGDPDLDDIITYSFYLGIDNENLTLATMTRETSFEKEGLELGATYYWQIVAADNRGKETKGPIWRLSTYSLPNRAPFDPVLLYPASGAVNLAVDVQMRWEAGDPDGDALTYDVFLGSEFPLQKVGIDLNAPVYSPNPYLKNSTRYYLQVVAKDDEGLTNKNSPVWAFETAEKTNLQPNVPQAIFPADQAVNVALQPVISWSGGDPDGDAVSYYLFLSAESPPQELVARDLAAERYSIPADLEEGRKYYWKVLARDVAGNEVESKIFSFFTISDIDGAAPEIVSLSPEDGAVALSPATEVRVIFNEPVDKTVAVSAFSFEPATTGSWTWENDSTARFWPQQPWPQGSFHKFRIADNVVRDLNNNLMVNGKTISFTIDADIPVPNTYRSTGFPISATPGDTINVSVPALPSGGKSYAVVVAEGGAASFTVRASHKAFDPLSDPASAFRKFEQRLASLPLEENISRASTLAPSLRAQVVGNEREFFIPVYGQVATTTAYPGNKISATCYGATDNVFVYVDNSISGPSSTLISEVRKRFEEGILPKVRDVFGTEPEVGPDGESGITILLTDALAPEIAGIFNSADLFSVNPGDVQLRESNERKIFYVKYSLASDITRYGTLAHEFQHMVNFWQKRINGGQGVFEATWLNEGLSKYSEEVCGYGILQGDENTALLIKLSQENFSTLSLTEWSGLNSYGLSYLFVRFLAAEGRYGTTYRDITRALVKSGLSGKTNVETVTNENFSLTLARWGISLYVNNYSQSVPDAYGFADLNLQGNNAGVTLPGFTPVSMSTGNSFAVPLKADGLLGFVRQSSGTASTDFEVTGFSAAVKIWLFDQR